MDEIKIILYNKPVGEICTRADEQDRPTVFDNLPTVSNGKWINIGRLDINTSGLLLFTNNGELANKLMHPKSKIEREYLIRLNKPATAEAIRNLSKGVKLEDGMAKFKRIKPHANKKDNKWYKVILTEGRNREVRRLWEHEGYLVSNLIRVRFGQYVLPKRLGKGKYITIDSSLISM